MKTRHGNSKHLRQIAALAIASTFLTQNFAWAVCSDGLPMPPGINGYQHALLPPTLQNMAPGIFTGTAGSVFVPDNSTFEGNNPATGTLTSGGHNWQFDQGSTTCKAANVGTPGEPATSWSIPPNTTTDCFVLPIVKAGRFTNFGNIPLTGQAIVPICDPTKLSAVGAPNPLNTRLNQIGCSISQLFNGVVTANDVHTAPAFIFVAGIQGGLFAEELGNTPNESPGDAGRVVASIRYYSDLPEGLKQTNAAVSPDGHFAISTSIRRNPNLFVCNNPLGDPGDITQPLPTIAAFANSFDPDGAHNPNGVKCLSSAGTTGLQVTLTNTFGPDNQPYMGGQRTVTSFNQNPGSYFLARAWPQCLVNGKGTGFVPGRSTPTQLDAAIKAVFTAHGNGGCGAAIANTGFSASVVVQPQALIGYTAPNGNLYMFTAGVAQPVMQFALGFNADGSTNYKSRTYMSGGTGFVTGLGIAPDMSWGSTINSAGNPSVGATGS